MHRSLRRPVHLASRVPRRGLCAESGLLNQAEVARGLQEADNKVYLPDASRAGSWKSAVQQYIDDGYVVLRDVIDADLAGEMSEHVDWLVKKYPDIPPEHLHHTIMRNDPFWVRVVSDPRLVSVAKGFLGVPDVALFSSHYFCKMPGTGMPVLWHQDGSYWPIRPMTVTTMWLAVDSSDTENGCLQVVKRSHRETLKELNRDVSSLNVLGSATHTDDQIDPKDIVDLVLNPGDVSLHHPNLVHGSKANTSNRRRCGLTLRYIPTTTEVLCDEQPVLLLAGEAVEGVNNYRSWPPYREGSDFQFKGSDGWNDHRYVNPQDEAYFDQPPDAIRKSIVDETLAFVDALGGRH